MNVLHFMSIELIVVATAILLLGLEAFGLRSRKLMTLVGALGLLGAAVSGLSIWDSHLTLFNGSYYIDNTALYIKELMLLITFMALLVSYDYSPRSDGSSSESPRHPGEFYALMMFVCVGMLFMASAGDLVTIFIALETTSMPLYVLAASLQYNQRSAEAGLKFFLLGALASAFYLFGASLLIGSLGTVYLGEFPAALAKTTGVSHAVFLGMLCVMAAFAFKIAAAPFHMWAPDVYQGAPTPVTAFLSTGPKVAGVAVLMRLLMGGLYVMRPEMSLRVDWVLVVSVLALLSMTVGNLVAMHQSNIKRMMAYSGIAHMGYILVGLAAASPRGVSAILFYLFIYTLTNLGAWGVVIVYGRAVGSEEIKDFAGMSRRAPGLAALLLLAFLSLAGLPPLGGFIGKFYLFAAAWQSSLPWLVAVGIVNSVASLYYYLGVLKVVYFEPASSEEPIPLSSAFQVAYCISLLAIVAVGLVPQMTQWTLGVGASFLGH